MSAMVMPVSLNDALDDLGFERFDPGGDVTISHHSGSLLPSAVTLGFVADVLVGLCRGGAFGDALGEQLPAGVAQWLIEHAPGYLSPLALASRRAWL
jgi:hypothetical protein